MMGSSSKKSILDWWNQNWPLALPISCLAFVHSWYMSDSMWPAHDTVYASQVFYSVYNNLFFNHEFTRWFPYGTFGIQADQWIITIMTPASYLWMLIGLIFRVTSVFVLFKSMVFFELLMLLFGTYLLGTELYERRETRCFVAIAITLSTIWILQLYFNFRIFYLIPLVLYFLINFFRTGELISLGFAGIVFISSQIGNNTYFGILNAVCLGIFSLIPMTERRRNWLPIKINRRTWLIFAWLFIAAGCYFYFASHALDHTYVDAAGRDPLTHKASLDDFLHFHYGYSIGFDRLLDFLFPKLPDHGAHTLYIGFLPLVFFLYALLFERKPLFWAVSITFFFLALFSAGDQSLVAPLVYRIPLMPYYRYIGYVGGLLRLFLILASGFGFERFLASLNSKNLISRITILILGAVLIGICLVLERQAIGKSEWPLVFHTGLFLCALALILVWISKIGPKTKAKILILLLIADLGFYQKTVASNWKYHWPWVAPIVTQVARFHFQSKRSDHYKIGTRQALAYEAVAKNSDRLAVEANGFILQDPCISMPGILVELKRVHDLAIPNQSNSSFFRSIGCESNKLKLIPDLASVDVPDIDFDDKIHVQNFSFNQLELDASVDHANGKWLYYADAFHPGWDAWVDGEKTKISEANSAFKAIYLPSGSHHVRFKFFDGTRGYVQYLIAFLSILFALWYARLMYLVFRGNSLDAPALGLRALFLRKN